MAKLKGPLCSATATGTIGNKITYQGKNVGFAAYLYKKKRDANTDAQKEVRAAYSAGVLLWHDLTAEEKEVWENYGG